MRSFDYKIPIHLGVANILANEGNITDAATIAAALLHDTIEDTETSVEELRTIFGDEVTNIVLECTDDKNMNYQERKNEQIVSAPSKSYKVRKIHIHRKFIQITLGSFSENG